ncbi:YIP1 family protein [Ruegeria pomeroyi]|uniref:YIP1 family protein n=1 Tax=Ruegeria pomeroyi TaxID=89184 RepID=A0A9Q3ZLI3_9RHOB|nr:YIP1 family protein [Ruegeria pomeroyi]MCE8507993.1 YIP1 family protein [Ruegeria pomeroyi]MCE8511499.1 YIP1 family protein [Ruegeria pomeroyi]MCE8518936.1 YIP1 family protein [Ruegeria pomeroyi]MCE8523946.1 YIP1 family protein [Ruegeria pomeroyi]MCE8527831.1 YIP1 family protein [Ruegeria pomeroyi]
MPVTSDIAASYRGPARVMRHLLDMGQREDRALAFVMAFCVIAFVAQLPALARRAHLEQADLNMLMGGALLGSVFLLPLLFYVIALLSHWVARMLGGQGSAYGARLALFWSLLASTPLVLLNGLVAGFIGPGPALSLVGLIWVAVFAWFWLTNLREAQRPAP